MKQLHIWLLSLFLLLGSTGVNAQAVVIDPANLVENILQQISGYASLLEQYKQYTQMIKDYEQVLKDFENQKKQLKAMTGSRGLSTLRNGAYDREFLRRYMPADFDVAMNTRYGSSSSGPTQRYAQYLQNIVQRYGLREVGPEFERSLSAPTSYRNVYDDRLRASQASMAAARTAQLNVDARLQAIEDILGETDGGGDEAADMKRAMDLNTRAVAEQAFLQAELIRVITQQSMMQGLGTQEDLAKQSRRRHLINYRSE